MNFFIQTPGDEIGFYVQAVPNAAQNRIMGIVQYHGQIALKVAIAAPPVDHKANVALGRFLAQYLNVPRSHVTIIKGHTGKLKLVSCAMNLQHINGLFKEKGWVV